jgi:ferredoxin
MSYCNYCDPKYFVIYGFCKNCKRRCEPPLFDPDGSDSLLDYEGKRRKWNEQRSDLVIDAMRRCPML